MQVSRNVSSIIQMGWLFRNRRHWHAMQLNGILRDNLARSHSAGNTITFSDELDPNAPKKEKTLGLKSSPVRA